MAATRLIALHRNKGKSVFGALSDRTNYAMNPDKTEDGFFVTGYECDPRTVNEEFMLTKREYDFLSGLRYKNEVIAYQIRQSFKPGEVTPEEANEIGRELALRFTKGDFAFIVATHTDKAHIHNHIIFNSTRLDGKRKFRNFWRSGLALQKVSDLVCLEHGLSVITPKPYSERAKFAGHPKRETVRSRIMADLEYALASGPKNFEDLLKKMADYGYEIKTGKHISVRKKDQKSFIRLDSLSEGFRESDLRAIFEQDGSAVGRKENISLLIDVQKKMREKGTGYARWATVFNLKQMAKTLLYLRDHNINSLDEIDAIAEKCLSKEEILLEKVKKSEKRLGEIADLRRTIIDYIETKETYVAYKKAGYSKMFKDAHLDEIERHNRARQAFNEMGGDIPKLQDLNEEYKRTLSEKREAYKEYASERQRTKEILIVQENIRSFYKALSDPYEHSKANEKER